MKLFNRLSHGIGLLLLAAVWLIGADRASAVFTLAGTPAELVARGISADFETPAQARADTESTSTNNIGAGWTMNLISGISNNFGVADPAIAFYNTAAGNPSPLPGPFEGFQFGFFNLNNWYSQGEIVSNPIGRLQSGQTYTLNVAVGARNSTAQDQVAYRVGLRAFDGTDLGTFSLATLVPSASATNISDLTYTLDTSTIPGSFIGKPVRVVIGGYNTGLNSTGTPTDQLAQPNFDNVRLSGTFDDLITQAASLTINRQTGGITLANTGSANVNMVGYSLTSAAGSLNQLQWTHVGSPLAQMSASGSSTDLSEASLQGGSVSFSTSSPISLGSAWYKTPYQDIQAQVLLDDGTKLTASVTYSGTAIASGDLNADGIINVADWTVFKSGSGTSFTGLSKAQSYPKGDMNGDLKHDLNDFQLFRAAFNAVNGAGAFETMSAVPEPATALLLSSGSLFVFAKMRRRTGRSTTRSTVGSRTATAAIVALACCALLTPRISAQTTLAHWTFDTGSLTTNAGNITGVADTTGSHNATTTTPAGGTGGTQYTSNPIPTTSSITGRFGQGLTLTGFNNLAGGGGQFLTYPNLNELTTVLSASGAPSYTVSYWLNTTTTNSQQFTLLGDWGTSATNPGRFTYGYGINFAAGVAQLRAQSRFNTTTAGNGTDIFARATPNTPTLNNGSWHMLTWTFNTTTGALTSYFDAAVVDTFTSTAANFNMVRSSSANGTWGLKGDSGNFLNGTVSLDEAYVFNNVLSQDQITNLFANNSITPATLTLRVDPATGQAQLRNSSGENLSFGAYRITSAAGSLKPSGWTPIASQSIAGFPTGDGSGNGWETPPGGSNPADYNSNGAVDAADYVAWRKNNINGQPGYNTWRAAFGAAGGAGGSVNEIDEWYLRSTSTFTNGASINLGQAFNIGGAQDLAFQFTTASGLLTGIVEYGSLGSGAAGAVVPEPSSGWLVLAIAAAIGICLPRRARFAHSLAPVCASTIVALLASLWTASAMATVTNDRVYQLGDDSSEHASAGIAVGSGAGNVSPGATLDSLGPTGSFQDLLAVSNGGGALPTYADVSTRPGATAGSLGIAFDGVDDYLNGYSLGLPPLSRGTINGGGSGTLNYNGVYQRGFQLWVKPNSGATAAQHVVMDTTQHGLRITAGGNWASVYAGTEVNSNVPVAFNQWSHVMVAIPDIAQPYRGVLYVNGVAIAANQANYSTSATVNAQALIVGANSDANGTLIGTTNFFRGTLDDLNMFIWGRGYNSTSGAFTDFGTFNFRTDNAYAAANLSPTFGDIAGSPGINQIDVNAFVAGWLHEKRVNNLRVGDITTYAAGDLNFDGITDLADAALFRQAMGLGAGAGLDLSAFNGLINGTVPEPSAVVLITVLLSSIPRWRRRKK